MEEKDEYINRLKNLLVDEDNSEIVQLVNKLIDERNYLQKIANIDVLTGLYNRRIINRIRMSTGVLVLDIDNFKSINDTFGHNTGDLVIKKVSQIIKNSTRAVDFVCRIGGDEFVAIFVNCPDIDIIERAELICNRIQKGTNIDNYGVTVSVGISINDNNSDVNQLIIDADNALNQAKRNGKNQVRLFNKSNKRLVRRINNE